MGRTFLVNKPAPMPPLREPEGTYHNSRLPGGMPPEPYRNAWKRSGDTGRRAREPFNSHQARGEYWADALWREYRDRELRH